MFGKHKAFTLAEILIMVTIIAIITVLMIQTTKNLKIGYKTLYYFTLKNVQKAAGELASNSNNALLDVDDDTFCNKLVGIFNTVGYESSCGPRYQGSNLASPFAGLSESMLDNPTFVITNGQRFYISNRNEQPTGLGYRVFAVDLNGKGSPNAFDKDIVSFAVFDNAEVIPLGIAADNTDYLVVNVKVLSKTTAKQTNPSFLFDNTGNKFFSYRHGICAAGYSTSFADYCDAKAGFLHSYYTDDKCLSSNELTFCQVNYIKPLIKTNI